MIINNDVSIHHSEDHLPPPRRSPARPDIKKAAVPEAPTPAAAKGTKKTTKEAKVIESKATEWGKGGK